MFLYNNKNYKTKAKSNFWLIDFTDFLQSKYSITKTYKKVDYNKLKDC